MKTSNEMVNRELSPGLRRYALLSKRSLNFGLDFVNAFLTEKLEAMVFAADRRPTHLDKALLAEPTVWLIEIFDEKYIAHVKQLVLKPETTTCRDIIYCANSNEHISVI